MSHFGIIIILVYSLSFSQVPSPAPAPPPPTEQQLQEAYEQGQRNGETLGETLGVHNGAGRSTQVTEYNTLQKSSVDSMMNGQQGEAASIMLSESLTVAAQPYANNCDPKTTSGNEACATGSVLAGMSGMMQNSSTSFAGPIQQAWSNVCHFSTFGCSETPPNPYTPITETLPNPPPNQYHEIINRLENRGYIVNPKTGLVTTPNGETINPGDPKSVEKALGGDTHAELKRLLDKMQKDINQKLAQIKEKDYMKSLGLDSLSKIGDNLARAAKGASDLASDLVGRSRREKIRYNRLPEKEKEKVEISDLIKNYNGSPIGVAAANIFKMINKRYQIKASERVFLSPEVQTFTQTGR